MANRDAAEQRIRKMLVGQEFFRKTVLSILHDTCEEELKVHQLRLGRQEVLALAEALTLTTRLKKLNLGHNDIGDEGGKAIAAALKHNK